MVSIMSLWMPILLSAVFVFIVSSVIHMALKYHQSDFAKVPDEEALRGAVGPLAIPPGDYAVPYSGSMEAMASPEWQQKCKDGPIMFMTVFPNGVMTMGKSLGLWFLYAVLISVVCAYVAGRTFEAGADYLSVFRLVGTVGFASYSLAHLQDYIWFNRNLSAVLKSVFDGLVYGAVTAGTFGWLWPS